MANTWSILRNLTGTSAIALALTAGMATPAPAQQTGQLSAVDCVPDKVCRDEKTRLPLRVLPRPNSAIYKSQDDAADNIKADNITAFRPLYAFAREDVDYGDPRNPTGWYEVGATDDRAIGWMKAADVLEWRQSLIVAYTHPGEDEFKRLPVIGFEALDPVRAVIESDDRKAEADGVHAAIEKGDKPGGYVMREPGPGFIDIDERDNFYILPILDWDENPTAADDAPERYLQIVSAVPNKRGTFTGADAESDDAEAVAANAEAEAELAERISELGIDAVFVMDTTASMEPYIQQTLESIQELAQAVELSGIADRIRFGLVGYRDNVEIVPGLEYTTRNYTPDLLESEDFAAMLGSDVKVARGGSKDFQEEVFAGVEASLQSEWSSNAIRVMVIVGDASSHAPDHPQSVTKKQAQELRAMATGADAQIIALHIRHGDGRGDWPVAEEQFSTLASNAGGESSRPDYIPIEAGNQKDYIDAVQQVHDIFAEFSAATSTGSVARVQQVIDDARTTGKSGSGTASKAAAITAGVLERALIDYQGDATTPPRDITFWTSDRDLGEPWKQALSVRLLITRAELNNLTEALEAVLVSLKENSLTGEGFMTILKAVVTDTMKDSSSVSFEQAQKLTDSRLFPSWLESLPYRSRVQSLSPQLIDAMSEEDRYQLELDLESQVSYYKSLFEDTDRWVWLSEKDESVALRHVYPIPIENLP